MLLAFQWEYFLYRVGLCNWLETLAWKYPNYLWESRTNLRVVYQVIWIVLLLHLKCDPDRLSEG